MLKRRRGESIWHPPLTIEHQNISRYLFRPPNLAGMPTRVTPPHTTLRLSAYLSAATDFNQREVVGLLRALREVKPAQTHATSIIRDTLRAFVRCGVSGKFKQEINCLTDLYDEALAALFVSLKKDGVTLHTFWDHHKDICCFVINSSEVEEVLKADTDWAKVAAPVSQLSSGSRLGSKMFGFAHIFVASQLISDFMGGLFQNLGVAALTSSWSQEATAACLREAERLRAKDRARLPGVFSRGLPGRNLDYVYM